MIMLLFESDNVVQWELQQALIQEATDSVFIVVLGNRMNASAIEAFTLGIKILSI